MHAEVAFHTINPGDRIFCSSRIDLGTQPPSAIEARQNKSPPVPGAHTP